MNTLDDVLQHFREMSANTRQQGDYFERLIKRVLTISPWYQGEFSNIWLWNDWPGRGGKGDLGIDLVAERTGSGDLVAIQCKFYEEGHYLDKEGLNSFFAALGQEPFREGMVFSTTDNWSKHAEGLLDHPTKPVNRVRFQDLRDSGIDWSSFVIAKPEESLRLSERKQARPHQRSAIEAVKQGFDRHDRGQLIMACGTGKTLTSLKLVEEFVPAGGHVLFLVPSISLLQQTLTEWKRESARPIRAYAVCSDVSVGKKEDDTYEIRPYDLVIPATTDPLKLSSGLQNHPAEDLTVVFSTYQSISKVSRAQQHPGSTLPAFDLVICDEAHRTTGVALSEAERSEFLKVHENSWVDAKKRLYMTATPRIYSEDSRKKADEGSMVLASMDDEAIFGPVFHRLGFGEALEKELLADYKVLILTVSEAMLEETIDLAAPENMNQKISLHDAVRIIGCWNGIAKRDNPYTEGHDFEEDPIPMRRAVAFSRSIKDSKHIRNAFSGVTRQFIDVIDEPDQTRCEVEHVDGTDSVLRRSHLLDWLKEGAPDDENCCRILSNARCLSEGVDVPALDAVLFLNPRDSVVDVVQSVGRVMRKSEDKKFGYIILPIPVPPDQSPEEALNDNANYRVVWQVLQALRAHDDRFNAMVNQLDLNKKAPKEIVVIDTGGKKTDDDYAKDDDKEQPVQLHLDPRLFAAWKDAIYARIVLKVGDRRYWDSWAQDIAKIANTHIERMLRYLDNPASEQSQAFNRFLTRLHEEINPAVSRDDAIEMLAQHLITKPVFEALFENEAFSAQNPVSYAMQQMLDDLGEHTLEEERATLQKFYRSVQTRADGIDNAAGRQAVVVELYDKFFRNAFPKMAERLGIVYTPVEVVDYLLHSADHVLREHFGKGLTDEGVHILDPFTGTGTFITRLLQSGLIEPKDAARKYDEELHANELVLLAYYIAAVNIESVFQEAFGGEYRPFTGIVWTDTFQMSENEQVVETDDGAVLFRRMNVGESTNSERATEQILTPITVIVGNPPYSAGQTSVNDENQNLKYPQLDQRIALTYAAHSTATLKRNLYDSYIRAIRWASDRIGEQGVVAFVTNAGFIDGNAMDGVRACLTDEFSELWVFNARGNQRTSGETSRMEGGKLFGSGSRAPIALTLLVKDPNQKGPCQLHYYDIGDYLTREEKLSRISAFEGVDGVLWARLTPNEAHDWINLRDVTFERFELLTDKDCEHPGIFAIRSQGANTARAAWIYNFNLGTVSQTMREMIMLYNQQVHALHSSSDWTNGDITTLVDYGDRRIKWDRELFKFARRGTHLSFSEASLYRSMYRPFLKQWLYFNKKMANTLYKMPSLFPTLSADNLLIDLTGTGVSKEFSALMTDSVVDVQTMPNGQVLPLYWYEPAAAVQRLPGIDTASEEGFIRHDGITDVMHAKFQDVYDDPAITKEDLFYYVYGVLHSNEYRERFAADLKKMLPRIPFTGDFWAFSAAGRELGELHVGYESVEPWPSVKEMRTEMPFSQNGQGLDDAILYRVEKMRYPKNGKVADKTTIIYNQYITLMGIPLDAYDYVVNGKSAIEWIMERYAWTQDKESRIVNDPNEWSDDPRYIVDLLKRIVRVSIETNRIVASLPPLNERDVDLGIAARVW